jgi:hypothetical protein
MAGGNDAYTEDDGNFAVVHLSLFQVRDHVSTSSSRPRPSPMSPPRHLNSAPPFPKLLISTHSSSPQIMCREPSYEYPVWVHSP